MEQTPQTRNSRPFARIGRWLVVCLVLLGIGAALGVWLLRPRLTDEALREIVSTTIQREAPASYYVTGTLDVMTTTTVANSKTLFPGLLNLDLGTTSATVRMPGRVSYGFDVRQLRPEQIRRDEDGVIRVTLPPLSVWSVEPDLDRMEVQTSVGWARSQGGSGRRVEHRAIRAVEDALRQQGAAHVRTNAQPRIHTARALELLLTPALQAAGIEDPRFRFQIGPEIVMEPQS